MQAAHKCMCSAKFPISLDLLFIKLNMRLSCGHKWKLLQQNQIICPWWKCISIFRPKHHQIRNHKFDLDSICGLHLSLEVRVDLLILCFGDSNFAIRSIFVFQSRSTKRRDVWTNKDLCRNVPNSLFSLASSHRFTTLMTPFPATRGISSVPPMRSIFCSTFRFNSPLSLFGVVFVISWPKFDAGGILTMIWIVSVLARINCTFFFCYSNTSCFASL